MKEQLSTLKLLLDFMKKVHIESSVNTFETEESLMDVIKV